MRSIRAAAVGTVTLSLALAATACGGGSSSGGSGDSPKTLTYWASNQGASIAQQLCDKSDLMAVFGPVNSSVALAEEPIYNRCGLPELISYASAVKITNLVVLDDVVAFDLDATFDNGAVKGHFAATPCASLSD